MRREGFWLHLGRFFGQPVSVHLSLALGLLFVSNARFAPGVWVGFILLVLLHELGHAVLVKARGGRVVSIALHGLGGECAYVGASTELDRAIIAWGGVAAQAVVLVVASIVLAVVPLPPVDFLLDFFTMLLRYNVIMIILNLLPVPPLDGSRAWSLIPLLRARAKKQKQKQTPTGWRR